MERWSSAHWGKTSEDRPGGWHSTEFHQIDAAAVAHVYLRRSPLLARRIEALAQGLSPWVPFLIGNHDVGKYSDYHQRLAPDVAKAIWPERFNRPALGCQRRHPDTGYLLWLSVLAAEGGPMCELGMGTGQGHRHIAAALTGHHGMPPVDMTIEGPDQATVAEAFHPEDVEAAIRHVRSLAEIMIPCGARFPEVGGKALQKLSWLLNGFAVLCDWISSNQEWFQHHDNEGLTPREYWETRALPRAASALELSGVLPQPVAQRLSFAELCPHLPSPVPSPLQRAALDLDMGDGPWIVIVEDMPGSGKTEAGLAITNALMARGAAEGVYVALPTMATSNMMFERMMSAYTGLYAQGASPSIVLAHGRAAFSEKFRSITAARGDEPGVEGNGTAQCAHWLADSRKKALLAHTGVGTFDQGLLGALPSAHQSLRLFGLARNVLLVDEVHACDAYMNGLLKSLVRFQGMLGGSVVLMSATLPLAQRREIAEAFIQGVNGPKARVNLAEDAFPLLTAWSPSCGVREIPVAEGGSKTFGVRRLPSVDKAVSLVAEMSRDNRCVCWVRNTVGDAIKAYDRLVAELGAERVLLFHARFAPRDRDRIEGEVLDRFGKPGRAAKEALRPGTVLVATQVVEQSLDIDFDAMVSDLAPVDLLIQRAGRLQRHDRGERIDPVLWILGPAPEPDAPEDWFTGPFPAAAYVYGNDIHLWLGLKLLLDAGSVTLPRDARRLVEGVYGASAGAAPSSLSARADRNEGERLAAAWQAGRNALKPEKGYELLDAWISDQATPTRLGEPTRTIRLLRAEGGALRPWGDGRGMRAFADGDLTVRSSSIDDLHPDDEEGVAAAREAWPDKGKWCLPIPMRPLAGGAWQGKAIRRGKAISVIADPVRGVSFKRAE